MKDTYLIDYEVRSAQGLVLKKGKIKVKNKLSSLHAQTSLEEFLKKKVEGFHKLIVFKCEKENEIISAIKDVFGSNNLFK